MHGRFDVPCSGTVRLGQQAPVTMHSHATFSRIESSRNQLCEKVDRGFVYRRELSVRPRQIGATEVVHRHRSHAIVVQADQDVGHLFRAAEIGLGERRVITLCPASHPIRDQTNVSWLKVHLLPLAKVTANLPPFPFGDLLTAKVADAETFPTLDSAPGDRPCGGGGCSPVGDKRRLTAVPRDGDYVQRRGLALDLKMRSAVRSARS